MTDKERPKIDWTPISKDTPKEDGPYLTTTMFGGSVLRLLAGSLFRSV